MKLLRWMCLWLCLLMAISSTATVVQAQSVADLARQERERKKALASKTVLSNDSIAPVTGGTVTTASSTAITVDEVSKRTGTTDLQGHDEKYWRTKFDAARLDLKRAEDNLKLLDLKVADLSHRLLLEGIYTEEVTIRAELEKTRQDQAVAHLVLDDAQQKIVDLEDQLRRAGGPPGWSQPPQ